LKANSLGIRTAKLPIREYCSLKSSPVLTVNHVFEILIRFAETNSWIEAFNRVLPERKVDTVGDRSCVSDENSIGDDEVEQDDAKVEVDGAGGSMSAAVTPQECDPATVKINI